MPALSRFMGMAEPYHPGEYTPPDMRIELRQPEPLPIKPLPPKRAPRMVVLRIVGLAVAGSLTLCATGLLLLVLLDSGCTSGNWDKAHWTMSEVQKCLNMYRLEHGQYPASLDALHTREYFPNGVPRDPFTKTDFEYKRTDTGFLLICWGKDQARGGEDIPERDIIFDEVGVLAD